MIYTYIIIIILIIMIMIKIALAVDVASNSNKSTYLFPHKYTKLYNRQIDVITTILMRRI